MPLRNPVTRQFFTVAPLAPSTSTPYFAGDNVLPVIVRLAQSSVTPLITLSPLPVQTPMSRDSVVERVTVSPHLHAVLPPQFEADATRTPVPATKSRASSPTNPVQRSSALFILMFLPFSDRRGPGARLGNPGA